MCFPLRFRMEKTVCRCVRSLIGTLILLSLSCVLAGTASPEQNDFFENKVRPIFAEHCYSCHSDKAEKLKGGLRLDSADGLQKGGASGPAVVPGQPDASLLIKAVRYSDPDLQMPPKNKKLSSDQIASLETWVKMGAPVPSASALAHKVDTATIRAKHWAFQPVSEPKAPLVKNTRWVQTPVDNFVLASLEANKIKPAPVADRRTLVRRLSFDLLGLPPTCEEVESFVHDKDPQAYPRLVERLLASPHYGERWGRYWLDVARYADTKGYLAGGEERRYAFSYTYRDYVVRAFNEDKPYDRFLVEQIAGDRVAAGEDKHAQAALGFLTLGRRFLNNQNDIIDDRIDVVTRGTMGLTVACARCHDHKFDPISTKDYYALHGVFASSHEPAELPLLGGIEDSTNHQDYLKQKAKIEVEIEEFKTGEIAKFTADLRQHAGEYLLGAADAGLLEDPAKFDTFAGERKLVPTVLRRWMRYLEAKRKASDPVLAPFFESEKLQAQKSDKPAVGQVRSNYCKLFAEVEAEWKNAVELAKNENKPAPLSLPDAKHEALRQVLYTEDGPVRLSQSEIETVLGRKLREGTAPLRNKIEALNWTHPGAPPRAMALVDREKPENSHVLLRGNPGNPGEEVPRRFVRLLDPAGNAFTNGSGRLELAQAIASKSNPLTARVYVNRIWLHHFGDGLVNTPGDFGVRTEEPPQRGLLDYLAAEFMQHGWSTKYLHRLILLSATYQQSSDAAADSLRDPENHFLSRMNRQRLDFEAMRDTLLDFAGTLDLSMGGVPVDILSEPFSKRRTIYGYIDRQNLPGVFRTFDFANPDTSNQGRFHTTVPQQALFLMNSPLVLEQANNLAKRSEDGPAISEHQKIIKLYRIVVQREPSDSEARRAEKFLRQQPASAKVSPMAKLAQVLLLSNETMFVD
jgi:mono/diheme cytochrome c family protein